MNEGLAEPSTGAARKPSPAQNALLAGRRKGGELKLD